MMAVIFETFLLNDRCEAILDDNKKKIVTELYTKLTKVMPDLGGICTNDTE